ncbi:MAG: hypothetical protein IT348_02315 [Candidatus Eisenbacteria bacterium]|nr:hypothetical protein [Candidatus Eisenbacteria bacterium]
MSPDFQIPLGFSGVLAAIACLIGGAAWFADGYRVLRLRRALAALRERPLAGLREGLVRVQGRVSLVSPLFSPLGGVPCAGFSLEVSDAAAALSGTVRETRPFELRAGDDSAQVEPDDSEWSLPVTQEREFAAGEALGAPLEALLERHEELSWLRRRGGALRIVERALLPGAVVTVIASAVHGAEAIAEPEIEWARTGTDGAAFAVAAAVAPSFAWRLESPEGFPTQVLADGASASRPLPAAWRTLGGVLGPALALAGLLHLAHVAGATMAGGR